MKKVKIKKLNPKVSIISRHQLQGCLLIVKVGSDERPASVEDLAGIREQFVGALNDFEGCFSVLFTHHAVNFEAISMEGLSYIPEEVKKLKKKKDKKMESKSAIMSLQLKDK
jgi:hypothetical protein